MKTQIANNIKVKLYELLKKYYQEYINNRNENLKNEYNSIKTIYNKLNGMNYDEIVEFISNNKVPKQVIQIYEEAINAVKKKEDSVKESDNLTEKKDKDKEFVSKMRKELYLQTYNLYNKAKLDKSLAKQYNYLKQIYEELLTKKSALEISKMFRKLQAEYKEKQDYEKKAIKQAIETFESVTIEVLGNIKDKKDDKDNTQVEIKEKTSTTSNDDNINKTNLEDNKGKTKGYFKDDSLIVLSDDEIQKIDNINSKVVELQEKLLNANNSENEIQIRKEISQLCQERENIVSKYLGTSGIVSVKELESLEFEYARASSKKDKSYTLTEEEYSSELRGTIERLSDLKFFGVDSIFVSGNNESERKQNYEKLLAETNKKYGNLVSCVYQNSNPVIANVSSSPDTAIKSDNLISYLELYNLRNGYGEFKRKSGSLKIGNEVITASVYEEKTKMIKDLINQFVVNSSNKVRDMGGSVVVDDVSRNKDVVKQDMLVKMNEMYENMLVQKQSLTQGMQQDHGIEL
ncbi:MAG: hypothetical protein ACI33S_00060 [Bacilli bacterium]